MARVRSNPVENMQTYIMLHGGIDRNERLMDVEWIRDVWMAAARLANTDTIMPHHIEDLRTMLHRSVP